MFCTECGSNNSDSAAKCASCGHVFEIAPTATQVRSPTTQYQSATPVDDSGFISKLMCQSVYTTSRAKWFCETAEMIVNICVWIGIVIGGIITLYLMSQSVGIGLLNLGSQIFGFIFLFIFLIFAKLGLMALGSLIHISELLDKNGRS
jgi:hypothetical protein